MEKTCRTCIHRNNYECTCRELKESIFLESDFNTLNSLSNEIEFIVAERLGNILDNLNLEDDDIQKILELLGGECLGDKIVDIIKEVQENQENKIKIDLSNDFLCKYWR